MKVGRRQGRYTANTPSLTQLTIVLTNSDDDESVVTFN